MLQLKTGIEETTLDLTYLPSDETKFSCNKLLLIINASKWGNG